MMDANARTGKKDVNCGLEEVKVLGPCGRDVLNGNGERLLNFPVNSTSCSLIVSLAS